MRAKSLSLYRCFGEDYSRNPNDVTDKACLAYQHDRLIALDEYLTEALALI